MGFGVEKDLRDTMLYSSFLAAHRAESQPSRLHGPKADSANALVCERGLQKYYY